MKSQFASLCFALAILGIGRVLAAEKEKNGNISDIPIWTAPKRGAVTELVPGLNTILNLSDAQKQQIAAARDEIMSDESVKSARGLAKNDPTVTPEQREAARATIETATARLRSRVDAVLGVEQKAMIENVNGAYAAAIQEVSGTYLDKVSTSKIVGEERQRMQQQQREEVEAQFQRKLDEMLTPAQREALVGAAAKLTEKKSVLK